MSCRTYTIGHYSTSVGIIDLASHATYVVCVNFINKRWDLQFKVDRVFSNFSWQFYLLSELLSDLCREEIGEKILFVFCYDVWPGARTLAIHLISQHTTY